MKLRVTLVKLQAVQILWPHLNKPIVKSQCVFLTSSLKNKLGDKIVPKVGALVETNRIPVFTTSPLHELNATVDAF